MLRILSLFFLLLTISCNSENKNPMPSDKHILFIGTYTQNSESEGIYVYEFNAKNGNLIKLAASEFIENPSYLAIDNKNNILYAVNEISIDSLGNSGLITSLKIDTNTWSLRKINSVLSHGAHPCHISLDRTGNYALAANYSGGNISLSKIMHDGSLANLNASYRHKGIGPHPNQNAPHAHMIISDGVGKYVYATDLGSDKIYQYQIDYKYEILTKTNEFSLTAGTGPRHMVFHPDKPWVYVLGELNGSVNCFLVDNKSGTLTNFQTISTYAQQLDLEPKSADIHIHPNGKYLYASNRGELNNIAIYSINQDSGKLELLAHQSTLGISPRNFTIDPTGNYLLVANQNSNTIVVFTIEAETGFLIESQVSENIPLPVCLKFYNK